MNACGWAIPPFIIFKGANILRSWFEDYALPAGWRLATSPNGWTNNELGLEWIKHFDMHTASRTKGKHRLLILDGHESHHSAVFETYCREHNILTLCMPAHSSHLLQPLDVGCFGPLKKAYGRQIDKLTRAHITHIAKEDFLSAFIAASSEIMIEKNIQGGFRGAGIVPFDPQRVIQELNIKLKTPTPPNSRPGTSHSWFSKTPNNPTEAFSQTILIKDRITRHLNSSPTRMFEAIDFLTKGATKIMHERTLLKAEVQAVKQANEALGKRWRAEKSRLRQGETISTEEAKYLMDQIDVDEQVREERRRERGGRVRVERHIRRCGNCGETGHNTRTCQVVIETTERDGSK